MSTSSNQEFWNRSHTCGDLNKSFAEKDITIMGWVDSRRDLGNLIFIDLRDRYGITQVVLDPSLCPEAHQLASDIKNEYVIAVKGTVKQRPDNMINKGRSTGDIEVYGKEVMVYNKSKPLPFQTTGDIESSESLKLKYRYLDLRQNPLKERILKRIQLVRELRNAMEAEGFLDIETPYLYKSTPEGAREFLVPSRMHEGEFYALPQSPQLFKQILMVSGFDRYYQIVRCFRDEDFRADRQPEFSQLDCEMSFVDEEIIFSTFERVIATAFNNCLGKKQISYPFPRMTFEAAMENYGNDKPDTRFEMKLKDLQSEVTSCGFKVFTDALSSEGIVNCITVKGEADNFSRKKIDALTDLAKQHGSKGLAWAKVKSGKGIESWQSPIAKFFKPEEIDAINLKADASEGDLILFGAGSYDTVKASLSSVRNHLGADLGLYDPAQMNFLWVIEFPLMEQDPETKKWHARHHPFTKPMNEDIDKLSDSPKDVRASAYDMVLNGYEIGGGSIRIHDPDMQARVFKAIGLTEEDSQKKFGFLLDALKFGAPPHGGIAFGIARMAMILSGCDAIRDVIAFPKTQKGTCLMTGAPSSVPNEDIEKLHLKLKNPNSVKG